MTRNSSRRRAPRAAGVLAALSVTVGGPAAAESVGVADPEDVGGASLSDIRKV